MQAIRLLSVAALTGAGLMLASCETPSMTQEQCLAVDWGSKGYSDGTAGRSQSRLDDHIKACAEYGIAPDFDQTQAYYAGMSEGRRVYCTPANGFRRGAGGSGYSNGFCPSDLEQDFLFGYADGQIVYSAYARLQDANQRVYDAQSRASSLEIQIRDEEHRLGDETLTDEQRDAIRARLRRLRGDRERELDSITELQWLADEADREYAEVRARFIPAYGNF